MLVSSLEGLCVSFAECGCFRSASEDLLLCCNVLPVERLVGCKACCDRAVFTSPQESASGEILQEAAVMSPARRQQHRGRLIPSIDTVSSCLSVGRVSDLSADRATQRRTLEDKPAVVPVRLDLDGPRLQVYFCHIAVVRMQKNVLNRKSRARRTQLRERRLSVSPTLSFGERPLVTCVGG